MEMVREFRQTLRASGLRGAFKRYGWKLAAGIFCYYLVRDLFLYIFIPYFIATKVFSPT